MEYEVTIEIDEQKDGWYAIVTESNGSHVEITETYDIESEARRAAQSIIKEERLRMMAINEGRNAQAQGGRDLHPQG